MSEAGLQLSEHVAEMLDIGPGARVFEVDCGDGEFLYPFFMNGYIVGGTDADAGSIEAAGIAMPEGVFQIGGAEALDPAIPWDVVVCRSLSRAPSPDYIRGLVARMFAKATHAVALLDVPEQHHRAALHALTEAGAQAVQFEGSHLFARV